MYVAFSPFYPPELAHYEARNRSPDRAHETYDALLTTGVVGLASRRCSPPCSPRAALVELWGRHAIAGRSPSRAPSAGLGIAAWALDGSARYVGVGLPLGFIGGLGAYVMGVASATCCARRPRASGAPPERLLLVAALLGGAIVAIVAQHRHRRDTGLLLGVRRPPRRPRAGAPGARGGLLGGGCPARHSRARAARRRAPGGGRQLPARERQRHARGAPRHRWPRPPPRGDQPRRDGLGLRRTHSWPTTVAVLLTPGHLADQRRDAERRGGGHVPATFLVGALIWGLAPRREGGWAAPGGGGVAPRGLGGGWGDLCVCAGALTGSPGRRRSSMRSTSFSPSAGWLAGLLLAPRPPPARRGGGRPGAWRRPRRCAARGGCTVAHPVAEPRRGFGRTSSTRATSTTCAGAWEQAAAFYSAPTEWSRSRTITSLFLGAPGWSRPPPRRIAPRAFAGALDASSGRASTR